LSAVAHAVRGLAGRRSSIRDLEAGPLVAFLVVFGVTFAFGVWMASRGFRWNDAMSRAASALAVVHGPDAKLANIGFVWPPLPTLLGGVGALLYPIWPTVVSGGVSAALTTASCAGATAALLVATARRLGLSNRLGWAFALLVATNPILFLYASNGMPEGVALPFMTAAVCCLTLFWHTGRRLWVAAAGVALALGVATVYQGVAFGAAVFAALIGGILWSSEARAAAPQGRARAIEGLGLMLLIPPAFVGLFWVGANAVIMGNPLDFISGSYGYASFQRPSGVAGGHPVVTGDFLGALGLVGERIFPFLIPLALLLVVRLVDGRLWRVNSLSLVVLALSVPLGMVVPMALLGSPMGFLRYLIFPLFVAAGWGLYEITVSGRRARAVALIAAGWLAAFPVELWVMSNPRLAPEEYAELKALTNGQDGEDTIDIRVPVASYLETHVLGDGQNVLLDSVAGGAMVAIQIGPAHRDQLILTADRRFKQALARPGSHNVGYFLTPDPSGAPNAAINRTYPGLWRGQRPGFQLVKTLATPLEKWRIYAVLPGVRTPPATTGGSG
jgi:4-amino-4-deoxy-L-arabinose transferase-like glycosyltransferase